MSTEGDRCPTCDEKLKDGMFSSNRLLDESELAVVNEYHTEKATARCEACSWGLYIDCVDKLEAERRLLQRDLLSFISTVPIVSIHSPLNWDYTAITLVTAQTTTGTGAFTEIASTITDFLGAQSNAHNEKLKSGEEMCKMVLRQKALEVEANAVVAADIDYAELGGGRGLLMVCMSGTAVKLKNVEVLGQKAVEGISGLKATRARIDQLSKFEIDVTDLPAKRSSARVRL